MGSSYYDLRRWILLMYGARMIARQCITVSGVKTELLLSVTIVVNGEEGGVGTLGSESFPTCLPLRLASRGPCEALSYLLDKFRERFSNGAVTGPPHKQNKTKQNRWNVMHIEARHCAITKTKINPRRK